MTLLISESTEKILNLILKVIDSVNEFNNLM